MDGMNSILEDNLEIIRLICKEHHVIRMYAFGSVCTSHFDGNSDIDLLVAFEPLEFGDYTDNYFQLVESLEELLHRNVDLVTEPSLSNPYFIKSVESSKVPLYD